MWTVGSCTFLLPIAAGWTMDVKEKEVEACRDMVICGSVTGNGGEN